ncbi:PepSY domain-containing protein [Nitrospirillum sp. BR 11828]|uniref:PepSY domain-containing protein n=1 Tax=Nitrospirillum sp. BR 11828 TaxID=3104325 RepID=UPI002ACACE75|nr:PepSY domain-containing protein [Nitrospirillum sp. BR 11828]MDZ5650064.1 PepSY domain-containing protein [Nitrospirillum sp. BR 11828]
MMYGKIAAAVLLAGSLGIGTYALAVETAPAGQAQPGQVTDANALTIPQVMERLAAQGYSDISEIKRHRNKNYKVEARDPQGKRVELAVDARTGDILKTEKDED